jgi:hypothetical protein
MNKKAIRNIKHLIFKYPPYTNTLHILFISSIIIALKMIKIAMNKPAHLVVFCFQKMSSNSSTQKYLSSN